MKPINEIELNVPVFIVVASLLLAAVAIIGGVGFLVVQILRWILG